MRGTHDEIKQKAKQLSTEEVLADLAQPFSPFELWSHALLCQRDVQPAIHLSHAENEELGGATRIPALLFESVNQSCKALHFEALHCCMNHIKTFWKISTSHFCDVDRLID